MDAHNRVIIHNQSKDSVIIFDHKGRYISSWGPEFQKGAHGCLLRKEDGVEYLYLSDYERHVVVKTTLDGETIWTIHWPQDSGVYKEEAEFKPTNTVVAPTGDIYVADGYGLSYIHQYDPKLKRIRTWGGKGKEAGKLDCPYGIWVDTRGPEPILIVADRANSRLQTFTLDGQHIGFYTEAMRLPCHFDQGRQGELLIPDLRGVVTIYDRNNKLLTQLGGNPRLGKARLAQSSARHLAAGQVHIASRGLLGSPRGYLRCGMDCRRSRHQTAKSVVITPQEAGKRSH